MVHSTMKEQFTSLGLRPEWKMYFRCSGVGPHGPFSQEVLILPKALTEKEAEQQAVARLVELYKGTVKIKRV